VTAEQRGPAPDAAKGGILVLGMHRSGTSAVARAINLLGVPLCRAEDLFESDGNNVRGYWESRTLMRFNDELLSALQASWRCPPVDVRMGRLHARRELAEGRRLLHWSHPTPQWVWKDPRNCALLPFWRRAVDVPVAAVTVLRHPVEVATSLASQRERYALDEALALWERNMRLVLRDASGLPMLVTRYDDLVADPRAWAGVVAGFLEPHGFRLEDRAGELESFLDEGLRHHAAARPGLTTGGGATAEQATLWDVALGLQGAHDPYRAPALPPESPTTAALLERNLLRPGRRRATAWLRALRRYGLVPRRPPSDTGAVGPATGAGVAEVRR
jgi:hypothetical protein